MSAILRAVAADHHIHALGKTVRDLMKANAGLLIVGIATFVLMGAGQSLYGPALPAFSRAFGVTIGTAGLLVSAHWVGCAMGVAGMFFQGRHVTPRHVVILMGLGAALIATGLGWWTTVLGAVVFGCGYGCSTVVFNPAMLRAFGARGPAMLSLLNATFGVGAIGAPLVFVALSNDPALTFALCAGLAAVIALGAGTAWKSKAVVADNVPTTFNLHLPILGFGMMAIGLEAILIGLGPAALIAAGETEVHAAQLLSAFFLAFLASRVLLIFIAHRLPAFTLYLIALTGTCIAALGAAMIEPGIFFVIMGAFAGVFFPGFYVTASGKMGLHPRVAPTIIAAGLIGGICAPLILSPWLDQLGERGFFWVIAAFTAAIALTALANLRRMIAKPVARAILTGAE